MKIKNYNKFSIYFEKSKNSFYPKKYYGHVRKN